MGFFNKTNTILFIVLFLLVMVTKPIVADDTNTQTNTSGSNTNITGGYDSESTTN